MTTAGVLDPPLAAAGPPRRRTTLTAQFAMVAALVAVIAVVVTGLVSYPLVANATEAQARRQLAAQADLVSDVLARAESGQGAAGLELDVVGVGSYGDDFSQFLVSSSIILK